MMQDLTITTIQTHLYWQDIDKNLAHFDLKIEEIVGPTDIIILPEMFSTGFTMKPEELAECHGGKAFSWMQKKAFEKQCVVVGSLSVKDESNFYNRLYWVNPDGSYQYYDKRHLFRMGNEHLHYTGGNNKVIIEYKGWKICPLVCYDLRFPVWSRNTKANSYDILIYVANWPEVRSYPWKQLLVARAIENQVYVVGVNRIGNDGKGIAHSGDSCCINPKGDVMTITKANEDKTETITLSYSFLNEFRKVFPVMLDGDDFEIMD